MSECVTAWLRWGLLDPCLMAGRTVWAYDDGEGDVSREKGQEKGQHESGKGTVWQSASQEVSVVGKGSRESVWRTDGQVNAPTVPAVPSIISLWV